MTERQIFERALEIAEPTARAAWLDEACAGNAALRAGVEALLASHEAQSGFLRVPAVEQIDPHATAPSGVDAPPPRPADATIVGEAGAEGSLHLSAPDGGVGGRGPDDVAAGPDLSFLSPATRPDSLGRIGHYEVLKVLGQGGFGIVLKAFDDALHRVVAIKVLLPQLAATSPPRKRFVREARAAAKVKHENVVQIYAIEEEPLPYLVMEYIDGPTLQEKLDECGPLETAVLLDLGRQIAAGLAAAHAQGLVHRDIKPGNILLEQGIETKIKLTDFGLARTTDDAALTHSGVIVGTPMYMAPEQALGQPVDARSDLFSLGSVLYQMASGRPPFRAPTLLAVLKRVADEQPRPIHEILAEVPQWLCDLIAQLHEKNPDARIQTAKEVADRLARGPETPPQPAAKHRRGKQPATAAIAPTVDHVSATPRRSTATSANTAFGGLTKLLATVLGSIALVAALAFGAYFASSMKRGGTDPNSSSVPQPSTQNPQPSPGWHGWPAEAPNPAVAPFDAAKAKRHQEEWAAYLKVPVEYTNSIGMKFRLIPPGEFLMGSTEDDVREAQRIDAGSKHWQERVASTTPRHKVVLTRPVYLAATEVTQAQYQKVTGRTPSFFAKTGQAEHTVKNVEGLDTSNHPAEGTSWDDAAGFCAELSLKENYSPLYYHSAVFVGPLVGEGYRLPTEAEYEFACRAGTTTGYWFGDKVSDLRRSGWFGANSGNRTHPVGELSVNPFGLYDVYGNVSEWVQDGWDSTHYGQFAREPAVDPMVSISTSAERVYRGGNWGDPAPVCRSPIRNAYGPTAVTPIVGFRAALTVDAVRKSLHVEGPTIPNGPGVPDDAIDVAAQRRTAEWVLRAGGSLRAIVNDEVVWVPAGGPLPDKWNRALRIEIIEVDLYGCPIVDEDLAILAACRRMRELNLRRTQVVGSGLSHLKKCQDLVLLGLESTPVTDEGLRNAPEFRGLASLIVRDTSIGDAGLARFRNCSGLTTAALVDTNVTDDGLAVVEGWKDLRAVWLGPSTKLSDRGLAHFRSCRMLQTVHVAGERITNAGLAHFEECDELLELTLWTSQLTDSGLDLLKSKKKLMKIDLRGNKAVTAAKINELKLALPRCRIEWDGGVIEPTEPATAWHGWPADAPKPAVAPFDAAQAKKHQEEWAAYLKVPVEYTNSIGMKFRLIPPGEFRMGSADEEVGRLARELDQARTGEYEKFVAGSSAPQHTVRITQPFYLSQFEATVGQYRTFIESSRHIPTMEQLKVDRFQWQHSVIEPDAARRAVIGVSWDDAQAFCEWSGRGDSLTCRLPTEAEWEYACRAGTTTLWSFGDDVTQLAAHAVHNQAKPWPTEVVGSKRPNPFGVHDLHGNADEWCLDWHDISHYANSAENDPVLLKAPKDKNSGRVSRGGSSISAPWATRSAIRAFDFPATPNNPRGFRPVLTVESVRKSLLKPKSSGWYGWPADAPKPAIAPFDAAQAKKHQEEWAKYLKVPVEYTNSIGMKFRLIPPGEFLMGSTQEEIEDALKQIPPDDTHWQERVNSEGPRHRVILAQPIYVGTTEVKQADYEKIMGRNPSFFAKTGPEKQWVEKVAGIDTSSHPVEGVSWNDAAELCAKLSQQEKLKPFYFRTGETVTPLDGKGYRLPNEAEWEFSCRAGTTTKFWSGDTENDLLASGWVGSNAGKRTHVSGELKANPFGLFDVHGNVWEWVHDAWEPANYGKFVEKPAVSPVAPSLAGSRRVIRGGNWFYAAFRCGSSTRAADDPTSRLPDLGFRVSLEVDAVRQVLSVDGPPIPKPASTNSVIRPSSPSRPPSPWPGDAPRPSVAPFDAAQAKKHQEEWAAYLKVPVEYTNSIGMKFRLIPPGEFMMGSTPEEIAETLKLVGDDKHWKECVTSEAPRHKVILTQPIYLGVTEVTQAEYEKVMGKNPAFFAKTGPDKRYVDRVDGLDTAAHPVEGVNWNDAAEFCAKLSEKEKRKPFYSRAGETVTPLDGTGYRLPTEAEWEFSCRAGTTTKFWIGDKDEDLIKAGWFSTNSGGRTHAVGELKANPLGLFDIHGNVYEWVQDAWDPAYYGQFQEKTSHNPSCPYSAGSERVLRGGGWSNNTFRCRSSGRYALNPTTRYDVVGFRVCLAAVGPRDGGSTGPSDLPKPGAPHPDEKTSATAKPVPVWPMDAPQPAIAPFDAAQAKKHQEEWAAYLKTPAEWTNSLGMKFRLVPPGEYWMGSTPEEIARAVEEVGSDHWKEHVRSEGPRRRVVLTRPFYLGITEVTQAEYERMMGRNPSYFAKTGELPESVAKVDGLDTTRHPVEGVHWLDAAEFCAKLGEHEKLRPFYRRAAESVTTLGGDGYRLPTEAEWEYACRAGTTGRHWTGDVDAAIDAAGWANLNSDRRTHPVGGKQPNPFGLFDVHGNVWEWVQDYWDARAYETFGDKPAIDPTGPAAAGWHQGFRGGCWADDAVLCRSAYREAFPEMDKPFRSQLIGFRVAVSVDAVRQALKVEGPPIQKPAPTTSSVSRPSSLSPRPFRWPADAPKPAVAPFDAAQAKKHQEEWATYLKAPVEYTNSIGMKFRLIPPGEFLMGSTADEITNALKYVRDDKHWEACVRSEAPQRVVILERPIYVGMHEVTQAEYSQVMGRNPSHFAKTGRDKSLTDKVAGLDTAGFPADGATWNDAAAFCDTLSQRESLKPFDAKSGGALATSTGTGYRLPTEAEWEFSCRAGTTSKYWIGDADKDLTVAARFSGNADGRTHAVGELKANPFGLFDVHGNVWEWVGDWWSPAWYGRSSGESAPDTGGPDSGTRRVVRGGHFTNASSLCRASARRAFDADYRDYMVGFRVALPVEAVRQALKVDGPAIPRTRATSAVSSSVPQPNP